MRDERKNKENAFRLMQRESKQCELLQKEIRKLKESRVALAKQVHEWKEVNVQYY